MAGSKVRKNAKKKLPVIFGSRIVKIEVGPLKRVVHIHEDLLVSRSPYFRNRLQKNRKDIEGDCSLCLSRLSLYLGLESETNVIKEPCLDADGFDMYIQWIYTNRVPQYTDDERDWNTRPILLVKSWWTGSSMDNAKFMDAILNALAKELNNSQSLPNCDVIQAAFEGESDYVLNDFFVDAFALKNIKNNQGHAIYDIQEEWATKFLAALCKELMTQLHHKSPGRSNSAKEIIMEDIVPGYLVDDGDSEEDD
ncbi:hypothetical protein EJ04DRAFT_567178 [Polyplosphaeria fusca]|uniref:BTB domain-containing protein n=1 Tax=Polyplosphaeria fusca TaxID=682080 RepID=A0A9P4V0B7_9PLEO|nr:hypothetical protein EJ04DRAFT_567178 [Polyplosphaeria fusca]